MYFPLFVGDSCFVTHYFFVSFLYSFEIILKRKRGPFALLLLSYGCLVTVNVMQFYITLS